MKTLTLLSLMLLFGFFTAAQQQTVNSPLNRQLTIEPALGIHTNFGTDLLISTLVQWTPSRLSFAGHSSFNLNNMTQRNFNNIHTDYNYSLNQKFGIGKTFYAKKTSHSFLIMVGAKYTSYQETLDNPGLDKVSTSISSLSPDYGMMYSLKKGVKNCFFSFRLYLPLYPWPTKGSDINYIDGNMNNIALEFGIGFRIK